MSDRIRIDRIQAEGAAERRGGELMPWGLVWYEIVHDDGQSSFTTQRFSRSGESKTPDGGLVWAATGPDDRLTLTPSFLCRFKYYGGAGEREVLVHLYLTDGQIVLVSDSTVVL